jgi:hypothetical protein
MSEKKEICVVLLCDDLYFEAMINTLVQIRQASYRGDVCLVIGDDLKESDKLTHPLLKNVVIKHFPDITFSEEFLETFYSIKRDQFWRDKKFQYHKLHLFNSFFKQWEYIFYIDSGIKIFDKIQPIIDTKKEGKLLAHSDAYHEYIWKLHNQFDMSHHSSDNLMKKYDLFVDYPQTTIMLYDTKIINDDTFSEILNLAEEVKISITNDQGIIALYFTNVKPVWEQIPLGDEKNWFYDYLLRNFKMNKPHIMLKRY